MDRFTKRKQTKEKRKNQICKTFEVKIDYSKLSKNTKKQLENLFREAKYFYNYCLNQENINNSDSTIKIVPIKIKDIFENRELTTISGQMKQGIKERIFSNISGLHQLKENGYKVGRLKFKSKINSIPLRQLGQTFKIDFKRKMIKVQKIGQNLKVKGLEQILGNTEVANAKLIRKSRDYYIHITTYKNKEGENIPNTSIGIDFGCETQLTFSNGIKAQYQVPITEKLKKLDRKIMKNKRKNSKNKFKDKLKREKEYNKITNKKKDIKNKIVYTINKLYKYVCFQDENIKAWQSGNHGKKIQNTGIGGIIADLQNKSHTPIVVNKFFPSTQLCPCCNKKNKLKLSERTYNCECGFEMDRDVKSAICIEKEGLGKIPMDCRKLTLGENSSSTEFFDLLSKIDGLKVSKTIR